MCLALLYNIQGSSYRQDLRSGSITQAIVFPLYIILHILWLSKGHESRCPSHHIIVPGEVVWLVATGAVGNIHGIIRYVHIASGGEDHGGRPALPVPTFTLCRIGGGPGSLEIGAVFDHAMLPVAGLGEA